MIATRPAPCVLAVLFVVVVVSVATAQTVTIDVDRGNGAEYQVGDAITINYAVSVDATVEVFDVSPAGMGALIDRRQARANQEYTLTGVVEPPLGVAVFEVKATTGAGQVLTSSAFIRVVAGEEPWAWLASADISHARLTSRRLFYELQDDDRAILSIHAAPQGGLLMHEGFRVERSCPGSRNLSHSAVHLLTPDGPSLELFRGAGGVFVDPNVPNSVFYIPAGGRGINEFDLVTGISRTISDFYGHGLRGCSPASLTALPHPNSDEHVVLAEGHTTGNRIQRIYSIRTTAFAAVEELASYRSGQSGARRADAMSWVGSPASGMLVICGSDCFTFDVFSAPSSWGWQMSATSDAKHLGLDRVWSLVASPTGGVHLVTDDQRRLWVTRLEGSERSNIASDLDVGVSVPSTSVAWDRRREVIYWVDGNRIYEGVLSAPSSQSR